MTAMEGLPDVLLATAWGPPDPNIWDRRRIDIRQWLRTQAPALAEVYEATVFFLHTPVFPARLHMIAHGIREIGNGLPIYLADLASESVPYRKLVEAILAPWQGAGLPIGDQPLPASLEDIEQPNTRIPIPTEIAWLIA